MYRLKWLIHEKSMNLKKFIEKKLQRYIHANDEYERDRDKSQIGFEKWGLLPTQPMCKISYFQ